MEIISPGRLPGEKQFQTTCSNCGTTFRFKAAEARYTMDQRDGDFYEVICPFAGCGHRNYVNPVAGERAHLKSLAEKSLLVNQDRHRPVVVIPTDAEVTRARRGR